MTLKKTSKKLIEIKLIRNAGEGWMHRRHRTNSKTKYDNGIEKNQTLQEIINKEQNKELKKFL